MLRRKNENEDMLITHKPQQPLEKVGRDRGENVSIDLDAPIEVLTERLAATTESTEREALISLIQARLGNREAERIIRLATGVGNGGRA